MTRKEAVKANSTNRHPYVACRTKWINNNP